MRNLHSYPVAVALLLAAAACNPIAEYTETEAPKRLVLDGTTVQVDLRFPPGSSGLAAREAARLRGLAATQLASSDRVLVAAGGSPALAAARIGTISTELLRYGVVASPMKIAGIAPDRAIVEAVRHQVTLPPCPNWSKWPAGAGDFTNTVASNFGCANATNLGRMVASPTDLASGQPLGPAAAMPATAAVTRYLTDKVTPPGPGAAAGGAGAGGAGGSTAGGP
jgi:pilus assembly protein CpaD